MPAKKPERTESVAYWKNEAKRNRLAAEAFIAIGGGTAPLEYLAVLGATQYVAIHGVSHGQGGYRMGVGMPAAQALVRAEQRALTQRARTLLTKLDAIVRESAEDGAEPPLDVGRAEAPGRLPKSRWAVLGDDKGMVDTEETPGD